MEEIKNIAEVSIEIDSQEEVIEMKNYYLFRPFEFVTAELQADKDWIFECENWSKEDWFAKEKKWLFLSDFIRKIGFVSKETTLKVVEEFLSKAEKLKEENEALKKENLEMKEKILKYQEDSKIKNTKKPKENLENK